MQDTFEKAMRKDDLLDTLVEPGAWLRTALARLAISRLRRRAVWERIRPLFREERAEVDPAGIDLRRALAGLPPGQRAAIVLRYYQGADYDEIARAVGVAPSSVGPLLSRAKDRLREALAWRTTTAS